MYNQVQKRDPLMSLNMNLVAQVSWLAQYFSETFNCFWKFLKPRVEQASVVIVRHYF